MKHILMICLVLGATCLTFDEDRFSNRTEIKRGFQTECYIRFDPWLDRYDVKKSPLETIGHIEYDRWTDTWRYKKAD